MAFKIKQGFTLIEIVVVVGILGLILPILFSVIFTLLRMNLELSHLQRVKEVGDFVSNQIITTVRNNATSISSTCINEPPLDGVDALQDPETESILFEDSHKVCFGYYVDENGTLASVSAALKAPDYTNYTVKLIDSQAVNSDFLLTVESPDFSSQQEQAAKVTFTVKYSPLVSYLKPQQLTYQNFIYLRGLKSTFVR